MSNVGILNPGNAPVIVGPVGASTVTITATAVALFTLPAVLKAPYQALWAVEVHVAGVITQGAAAATALVFTLATSTPTTVDTYTTEPTYLVNSAISYYSFEMVGPASASLYWPVGNVLSVYGASATHNCTLSADARAVFKLVYVGN